MSSEKLSKIPELLRTMQYKEATVDLEEATKWIRTSFEETNTFIPNARSIQLKNAITGEDLVQIYEPSLDTITSYEKPSNGSRIRTIPVLDRAKLLYQLGSIIQKNGNVLCQLEILARGISINDTKSQSVPLLVDYLQYYSGFCVKQDVNESANRPRGISVGVFSEDSPLFLLGCFLGPALAAGCDAVLVLGHKLYLTGRFIINLAMSIGFPPGSIKVIGREPEHLSAIGDLNAEFYWIFDNIYNREYASFKCTPMFPNISYLSSFSCPYLVFDDADLDSVCPSVIKATWGYQGMTPWSVRNMFVQENIFTALVKKLKQQVAKTRIGLANEVNIDVCYPFVRANAGSKLSTLVKSAKSQGIEVFQGTSGGTFKLTLFIGGNVCNNNVLKEDPIDIPVLTVTAFRTIKEGIALANNSRQGLAASVWTNNISLANEAANKLNVCNVWNNCHGIFSADTCFVSNASKASANAFIGGEEGFYEYVRPRGKLNLGCKTPGTEKEVADAIGVAKNAQSNWANLSRLERTKKLFQTIEKLSSFNKNGDDKENEANSWITTIYNHASDIYTGRKNSSTSVKHYKCSTSYDSLGVIIIEFPTYSHQENDRKLVVSALLEGNVVIMLHDDSYDRTFYNTLSQSLPKGVLTSIITSVHAFDSAMTNVDVKAFFLQDASSVSSRLGSLLEIGKIKRAYLHDCTSLKNFWTDAAGQSII